MDDMTYSLHTLDWVVLVSYFSVVVVVGLIGTTFMMKSGREEVALPGTADIPPRLVEMTDLGDTLIAVGRCEDGIDFNATDGEPVHTVFLILSGLQIHYPGFAVLGSMQTARFVHLVSGYLFIFLGILHVYFFFALGKRKIAMPHLSDFGELGPILKYYLFIDGGKPDYAKYNVLQKFAYAGLFVVSFLQTLLGFALYWPILFGPVLALFGGAVAVRIWHTTIMWVFLSFTAVHVYLVVSEDIRLVKAMVHGYYYKEGTDEAKP